MDADERNGNRSVRAATVRERALPLAYARGSEPERLAIAVTQADYASGFRLRISFTDGKTHIVDLEPFLRAARNPAIRDFLELRKFKAFRIEYGDLMWGDYDLCFPVADLYQGKIA